MKPTQSTHENKDDGIDDMMAQFAPSTKRSLGSPAVSTTEEKHPVISQTAPVETVSQTHSNSEEKDSASTEESTSLLEAELLPPAAVGPKVRKSAEAAVKKNWKPDSSIDGRVVPRLREIAVTTRVLHGLNGFIICKIGNDLMRAQELIGHGDFVRWLGEACDMSKSTAYNYMKVAKVFHDAKLISHLAPSTIYKLAKADLPEDLLIETVKGRTDEEVLDNLKKINHTKEGDHNPTIGHADTVKLLQNLLHRIEGFQTLSLTLPESMRPGILTSLDSLRSHVSVLVQQAMPNTDGGTP
jgi:Protein of unknown function (DUF3102)